MADTTQSSIDRINTLITTTFGANGVNQITTNQLLQLAALFDTLHDFGKYSTCYDTLSGGRSETVMANYKILRMRFSALSRLVFGIGSDILSRRYGSLRTPAQVYTSALTARTLEADFLEYAKQYRTTSNTGIFITNIKGNDYGTIMEKLRENGYGLNGTSGKVCLLVDTQKMLYKWSGFSDNCIVAILRESVYDAAGKLLIDDKTSKNVHVETGRLVNGISIVDYTYSSADSDDFVGNIEVSLGPIAANDNYKSYNIRATIAGTTIPVQGNSGAKHPNSILMLNKNIDGNADCDTRVGNVFITQNTNNVNKPYNNYVESPKNNVGVGGCSSFTTNNANFTQKRTGDGNQACICKRINTGRVQITAINKDKTPITIRKIVLVTIDRMLYAIALLLNIPVIYEHPDDGAAYIPNDDNFMGGGSSGMNDVNDIQPNQLNIPKTPTIYQRGGAKLNLARNDDDDDEARDDEAIYILENPVYMLALAPFIHTRAYDDSRSNFKTAIESILAMDYTTFMNSSPEYITQPSNTTYLRNLITTTTTMTSMDLLIGTQTTAYSHENNDIRIIELSSDEYTLIYKYGHNGNTYRDDADGRNLYIMKNGDGSTVAPDITYNQFGLGKIKHLFSTQNIQIDSESTEKIEEMLGELLATELVEGGYSFKSKIILFSLLATSVVVAVSNSSIGSGIYQFFNSSKPNNNKPLLGGKLSLLSDKSESSSSLDNSINNSGEDTSPDNSLTDDDSNEKSSENGSEQRLDVDAIDDSSSSMTSMSDSVESESEIMSEKFPLLTKNDNYYAVAFNYTQTHKIIRDHGVNLPFYDDLSNVFTMFSYLWLFNKYVVNVCIDDEETAIAYDEWSVKGDARTVLIPTHKSLYILFNKMSDIIKKEGTLPFLLTDLEQVLFDEKDYMYFHLEQIKRYVLRDDFIEVVEEKVDEAKVSEAKVDEAKVDEAKVDEAKVDEAKVDEPTVNEAKVGEAKVGESTVSEAKVGEPTVSEAKVGKEIILRLIKEANDEEQIVNTELSRLSETDNFDDLLKYAIDRNLTRYGMFYMYSDYLTYISTLSMKKSTPSDSSESSTVDNSIKTTTLDNSNDNSIDNSIKSSTLDNSNDNSIDNSNESTTLDNSNESSPVDYSNDNSIKSTSIYINSNKSSSLDSNSKSSSFDKNSKSSSFDNSLDNSIDNNSTSSSVSSAILSRGGIHKKKSSKINRKTKVHRVTKNKRKVSESRKSKKKKHSKRKLLAKKKRGTRKNNRK